MAIMQSVDPIRSLEPGNHLCCLYETEEEHRAVLTPFLRQGLERGEKVLYIVDAHTAEAILGYLRDDGLEVESYLASEQLSILAVKDSYLRGGVFDPDRMMALLRGETERALTEGYPALRATGEMTWALRGFVASERLIEYESKLNTFFPGSKCLAICQYDRRRFDPSLLLDVVSTHPTVVVGRELYDNFYYIPPSVFQRQERPALTLRCWLENLAARKQAEEALRGSESKFRELLESAPDAMVIVNQDGRIVLVNTRTEKMFGYCREELLGHPVEILVPERFRTKHREGCARYFTSPSPQHMGREFELCGLGKDGSEFPVEATLSPIETPEGVVVSSAIRDVTDRHRAAEELRRVNRALKTLSECNEALVRATEESAFLHEVCRIIVEIGGYCFAWVGFAEQDEVKSVRPVAYAGTDGGYLESVNVTWADTERGRGPAGTAIRTGRPSLVRDILTDHVFSPWRDEAARRGYASSIGIPLVTDRQPLGVLCIYAVEPDAFDPEEVKLLSELARDLGYGVTALRTRVEHKRAEEALRRSEASYRSLIFGATYGIFRCSAHGRFLAVNPAFVSMLGYASEAELLGMNLLSDVLRSPSEGSQLLQQYRQTGRLDGLEMEWRAKDGSPVLVRLSGRAVLDEQGALQGFEVIAENIVERRRLEEQLRQSQKMEAVGRLAGGVAHDFNNLLTIITGYSQLLQERLEHDSPLRGHVEEIQKAGGRAASLTRQLLAFSRRQVLQPQALDLNSVVGNVEKMLRRLIGEDIDLFTALAPDLGRVRADPGQIEQVIMNLAVNARDAMPQGGKLTLETANVDLDRAYACRHGAVTPGRHVMLGVSDTGCGMDEETQRHIFEPFFTTKEKGKGTGLGLAMVYGIVKQSGGSIWVYSEPGEGTTFKIYFPRVEEAAAKLKPREVPMTKHRGSETILVVEDDEAVRPLVRGVLQSNGYTVLEAGRGDEALLTCKHHKGPIHLMVTDMVMPGMSGRELAERLGASHPETKLLYISGYTDGGIVHQGVLDPGAAFLAKPFTPDALARKVREVLDAAPK